MKVITRILRAIKEWLDPKLKCKRLGCDLTPVQFKVLVKSRDYSEIYADAICDIDTCKRCLSRHGLPKNMKKINRFHSVSLPSYRFDELEKNGYILTR